MKSKDRSIVKKILHVIIWANSKIININKKIDKNFYANSKLTQKVNSQANSLDLKFKHGHAIIAEQLKKLDKSINNNNIYSINSEIERLILRTQKQFEKIIVLLEANIAYTEIFSQHFQADSSSGSDDEWSKWAAEKNEVSKKHHQLLQVNLKSYENLASEFKKILEKSSKK
ncbi:hypothetical protein HGG64_01300 [Mycoplasma phocoeninasale]|uniref:Uncharacterized protein n=1 Tax=Mycoplasma phocoeninasale TaxID=2726117 RepID=A0A858U6J2_9MOLU|nr:hypothetical protein [Mycoplasma phocoeninasale]QJG66346.1 hypothetical protein HGG64_01300 [Mycoplasma phocoeninasale]